MWLLQELYLFNLTTMLQLIINKTEDRETMIVSSDKKKKVYIKNDINWETDEWKLYNEIVWLLEDYLK